MGTCEYLHVSFKCMFVCVNERNGSPNTMNVLQWEILVMKEDTCASMYSTCARICISSVQTLMCVKVWIGQMQVR